MAIRLPKLAVILSAFAIFMGLAAATPAFAQSEFVQIRNRWKPDQLINTETGNPASSPIHAGAWSADWTFEELPRFGQNVFAIRNRYTQRYLHSGSPITQGVSSDTPAARWTVTQTPEGTYTIANGSGQALHIERGQLEVSQAQPGWWSAQWALPGFGRRERAGVSVAATAQTPSTTYNPATEREAVNNPGRVPPPPMRTGPARQFTQCVNNVFGSLIVARVKWYDPATLTMTPGARADDQSTSVDERVARLSLDGVTPLQEDVIPVLPHSSFAGVWPVHQPRLAVVSVEGGRVLNRIANIGIGITGGLAGAFYCAGVPVAECQRFYSDIRGYFTGRVTISGVSPEDQMEIFYVGTPGSLEVKGQATSPSFTETAPIR